MKTVGIINVAIFCAFMFLSFCALSESLSFGYGLGDVVYYFALWATTIILCVVLIIKKTFFFRRNWLLTAIFGCLLLYIVYSMTIGRGAEYPWNGKVFYN